MTRPAQDIRQIKREPCRRTLEVSFQIEQVVPWMRNRLAPQAIRERVEAMNRKKKTMRRIVQIIPADGWFAVFASRLPTGEVVLQDQPLACWALIEDEDEEGSWRDVIGLTADSDVEECYLRGRFVGYRWQGESIDKWRTKAERLFSDLFSEEIAPRLFTTAVPGD